MLSDIVNVSISRQTASISQAGFGTPLVLGSNSTGWGGSEKVRSYSNLAAVLVDFATSTAEYKAAAKLFAQSPRPVTVKIGKMLAKVAQIDTITPTAVNTTDYVVTIDGTAYTYTSDGSATVSEIVAGLIALINADSNARPTASGSTTLILTADEAGVSFTTVIGAHLAIVHTTANVGPVESLAAISLVDDDWYGLIYESHSVDQVYQLAQYIEGTFKLFGTSSSAVGCYDGSSTTDILYRLKAAGLFRTFGLYSGDAANFPEAALMGRFLPEVPGTEVWAFKTLAGVVVDSLTSTQVSAIKAKKGNYYTVVGGVSISLDGKVAGDEYIDVIRLIDLLRARMMEGIFGNYVRNKKIPFTNGGISVHESSVQGVLKANQKLGGIAPDDVDSNGDIVPGFSTSFPKVSEVSADDRAARTLTGATWKARLAGAIQAANIGGTVTV